jgi:hypothetical protein
VVQEAFVAAWAALPSLAEPAAFPGWLRSIMRGSGPIPAVSATHLAIAGGRSPPGKTLVPETLVVGWRWAKKACVVLIMPILCS